MIATAMRSARGKARTDAPRCRNASASRKPIAASSSNSSGHARLPALYTGASRTNSANAQKNVEPAGSTLVSGERVWMALSWG